MKKLLIGTLLVVGLLFVISVSNPERSTPTPALAPTSAPSGPVYAVAPGATPEGIAAAQKQAPAQPPAKAKSKPKQTFTSTVAAAAWYAAITSTPKEQKAGAKLVKSLLGQDVDVFHKLEFKDGIPTAWISRTFYRLPYEGKEMAVANAAAYYFWPNQSWPLRIHLRDARTGRKLGQFNRDGLSLK